MLGLAISCREFIKRPCYLDNEYLDDQLNVGNQRNFVRYSRASYINFVLR